MTKLLHSSETIGCGATLELDSKETCLISVARTGVLVKGYRGRFGRFWIGFFGATLYREKSIYRAANTATALDALFPQRAVPVIFRNPVLAAFTNVVWHCSSAFEVAVKLNEAAIQIATPTEKSPAELLDALCELMEQYPTALLDSSKLPAPKHKMKAVIKDVWKREPRLRGPIKNAYTYLSHFQDGIGDTVLDFKIPALPVGANHDGIIQIAKESVSGPHNKINEQWLMWEKISTSEMEILLQEWRAFEVQANA